MDVDQFNREGLDDQDVQVEALDKHPKEVGSDKVCQDNR